MGNTIRTTKNIGEDFITEEIVPENLNAKALITFGPSGAGKTWFTQWLLHKLKIDTSGLPMPGLVHTTGCDIHSANGFSPIKRNGKNHMFVLCDTEGFFKPEQKSDNDEKKRAASDSQTKEMTLNLDPFVYAIISRLPGLMVLMTDKYDSKIEDLLFTITALIPKQCPLIILHNRVSQDLSKEPAFLADLQKMKRIEIVKDPHDDCLYSRVNERVIEHMILFQHGGNREKSRNFTVFDKILDRLENINPDNLELGLKNAASNYLNYNKHGIYELIYHTIQVGEVKVCYRDLSLDEEDIEKFKKMKDVDQTAINEMEKIVNTMKSTKVLGTVKVIEICGVDLILDKVKFELDYQKDHFVRLTLTKPEHFTAESPCTILLWTPEVVASKQAIGEFTRKNRRVIFVNTRPTQTAENVTHSDKKHAKAKRKEEEKEKGLVKEEAKEDDEQKTKSIPKENNINTQQLSLTAPLQEPIGIDNIDPELKIAENVNLMSDSEHPN